VSQGGRSLVSPENVVAGCRRSPVPSISVSNQSPIVKFGISTGGKRASYWRVRAGMKQPELFLEREGQEDKWHLSLHASGQWHLKRNGQVVMRWTRPAEVVPGYTHAVGVVQPVVVAHRDEATPEDVVLVPVASDAEPTMFGIYMERPGANLNGWPGKNANGTVLVGRIPLSAGAGTCCIVALQEPLQPGRLEFPRPREDELRHMRESAVNGVLVATVFGELSDGAIALFDLRAAESVVATIDTALRT
jgi:hypothetical protein